MVSPRNVLFLIVLFSWFFAVFYAHSYYSLPITSDAFERSRVAALISSNQPLSTPYSSPASYDYPLLFDYLFATIAAVFQLDFLSCLVVLSILFSTVFAGLVFSFAKHFSDEQAAVFSLFLALLSPWLFYRLVTPISETLGLLLFFAAVFYFFKNRFSASFLFLFLLLFSHYRSFAVAAAVIVLYSLLNFKQLAKPLLATLSFPAIFYLFLVPKQSLENPWVVQAGVFDYFLPLLLGLWFFGLFVSLFKAGIPKKHFSFFTAVFFAPILLGLLAPFPFRQIIYVFPVVILFAAFFLSNFFSQTAPSLKSLFFAIALICALFSATSIIHSRPVPFSLEKAAALSALSALPGQNVLAPFVESYAIPLFSRKKVVAGAFLEGLPDGSGRAKDSYDFFNNASASVRYAILDKYSVDLVCLEPGKYPAADSWLLVQSRLQKKFSSPRLECWG